MKNRWIALWVVVSVLAGPLHGATYYVDDNAPNDPAPFNHNVSDPDEDGSPEHPFDSIQEAIDVAVDGDAIIVAPGLYLSRDKWQYDELRFNGKNIRVVSSAPTDFSVVERTVLCGVVIFDGTETGDCLLQGFKIQNYGHGGILGNGTLARISHCIISGNGPCGATVVMDVQGRISNCLIVDNTTFDNCGVMPVVSGCPEIVNCTIANNLSGVEITNIGLPAGRQVTVRNCIIYGNQGSQVIERWDFSLATTRRIEYLLLENWSVIGTSVNRPQYATIQYADPGFVRLGRWEDGPTAPTRAVRGVIVANAVTLNKVLIEGDYHLKSEGWQWSPEPLHGSHWYFEPVTSPAVDAGDPMDSLGEELERAPDDPEGFWGVNHAINLGAYGGTAQASLAPRRGEVPGIGAVDLRDYWPLDTGNQWSVHDPEGSGPRELSVSTQWRVNGLEVPILRVANASGLGYSFYCVYVDRTLYMTTSPSSLDRLPQPPVPSQVQYPQFLVDGAVIQAPHDPLVAAKRGLRAVSVTRGTLAEVLTGTSVDPAQFLAGEWPDVIALRELTEDGTLGDPTTIFARGFGPLLIGSQPIERATVGPDTSGVGGSRATGGAVRR